MARPAISSSSLLAGNNGIAPITARPVLAPIIFSAALRRRSLYHDGNRRARCRNLAHPDIDARLLANVSNRVECFVFGRSFEGGGIVSFVAGRGERGDNNSPYARHAVAWLASHYDSAAGPPALIMRGALLPFLAIPGFKRACRYVGAARSMSSKYLTRPLNECTHASTGASSSSACHRRYQ